jgi:hypothetical protein
MEGRSPSICAAGAPPHPKPSKFPAHSAPERAVAALCLKATPHFTTNVPHENNFNLLTYYVLNSVSFVFTNTTHYRKGKVKNAQKSVCGALL